LHTQLLIPVPKAMLFWLNSSKKCLWYQHCFIRSFAYFCSLDNPSVWLYIYSTKLLRWRSIFFSFLPLSLSLSPLLLFLPFFLLLLLFYFFFFWVQLFELSALHLLSRGSNTSATVPAPISLICNDLYL
jgi:hypothetical protein